jgi:hypothetical protein
VTSVFVLGTMVLMIVLLTPASLSTFAPCVALVCVTLLFWEKWLDTLTCVGIAEEFSNMPQGL